MEEMSRETQKTHPNFRRNARDYFTEYCDNTGIHGMKYIGEQKRTFIEKICWLVSLSVALYLCIAVTMTTYEKWQTAPVIVTFATKETPIWKFPFPTVTICPETKSVPTIFNYSLFINRKLDGSPLDPSDNLKLSYLSSVCLRRPDVESNTSKFLGDEIFSFFESVSPRFLDLISDCYFMGYRYNCSDVFTPIITDEGLCYSFNLLNRQDILQDSVLHYKNYHLIPGTKSLWSLEHGYSETAGKDTFPKRALYAGALFDFELKIRTPHDHLDFTCGNSIQGYKIQIHHPAMLPRVKQQHFRIPLDQVVIAAMMPTVITTSEAVRSYSPEKRECFLPSERQLNYFKVYTQQNCQIECKTNYTLQQCGCVDFYMPRRKRTKICGAPVKKCMLEAEDDLLSEGIESKLKNPAMGLKRVHEIMKNCNCMPECTAMTYVVENSQSDWDWVSKYKSNRNGAAFNATTNHMSYVQIFFKGNQFITSERNELYGLTDFLANFGGLLGLFTGFSLLSSIELLYFLTLRIWCNVRLFGAGYWAGRNPH